MTDRRTPMKLNEHAEWRADKMGKATLFRSNALMLGLNALEPGQAHAPHAHEGQDKSYLVLEGRGTFQLGDDSFVLGPGELLVAPAGVSHGVENDTEERLLVFVAMAPPP